MKKKFELNKLGLYVVKTIIRLLLDKDVLSGMYIRLNLRLYLALVSILGICQLYFGI